MEGLDKGAWYTLISGYEWDNFYIGTKGAEESGNEICYSES